MAFLGFGSRRPSEPLRFFGRDLGAAFLGHLVKGGFGWLGSLVLLRTWHPDLFGVFGLAEAVYLIAYQVSELGLSTGVNRFVAKGLRSRDDEATQSFLKSVFLTKLGTAAVVFALGQLLAPVVAGRLLERPEMTTLTRIALVGIFGLHLSSFYQAYLGARLEFRLNSLFVSLTPTFIFVALLAAWSGDRLTVAAAMWIYVLTPLAVCGLATWALPHDFLRSTAHPVVALGRVWRFSRWVYVTNTLGEVRFRLNSVYLARLADIRDVGLYNFADKWASTLTLFTGTILTVFVPRVAHLVSQEEIRQVLRRSHRWLLWLLAPLTAVPLAAEPFIRAFVPRYEEGIPYFTILYLSILFSLVAMPSRAVLYSANRAQVETVIEVVALAVTLVLGYLLVVSEGALGATLAMLLQRALSALLLIGWVHLHIDRAPRAAVETPHLTGVGAD